MDADQLIQQARAAAKAGNRSAAREILERAVVQHPDSAPAWYLLSQVVDEDEQVIQYLERVLEIDPYSQQARQRLMHWRSAANAPEIPEDAFQTAPPDVTALEVAEESVGSSTAVAIGALLLLLALVVLAYRVGVFAPLGLVFPQGQSDYQIYLPGDYTPQRRWPVFVGVHGFGGSAQDCWEWWGEYVEQEGFVLICPSLSDEGGGWYQDDGERALLGTLRQARREYNLERQVFITGFSAGGQFVQGFAFQHPDDVYAVTVLSAGNYYEPERQAAHIPFQIIIGERDLTQSLENAKAFGEMLEQGGFEYELYILPDVGHEVTRAGQEMTIEFYRRVSGRNGG
jgi:predicted esterase